MTLKDPELLAAAAVTVGTETLEALIKGASFSTAHRPQPQLELNKVSQPEPTHHRGLRRKARRHYYFGKRRSWLSCSRRRRLLES
jgi:hypothetical protein